jgi:DeoR family transcriptional regulator, glycerol-3-phosphate regulon repressor
MPPPITTARAVEGGAVTLRRILIDSNTNDHRWSFLLECRTIGVMMAVMARYEHDVMQAVSLRGSMSVRDLAALLAVSEQTVRRIVKPMVDREEISKVHGAIVAVGPPGEPPFLARMNVARAAKIAIATRVAELVHDGDSIALDTGSTTGFIAQALRQHRNLTVVTNSSFIATSLATIPGNRVLMAGVELRNHDGASFDSFAFKVMASLRVRIAVLSVSAVDEVDGFMVQEHCEAEMSEVLAGIADQRVVAVDHSKFGRRALVRSAPLRDGDIVVSDQMPDDVFQTVLAGLQVEVASRRPEAPRRVRAGRR